MREARRYRAQTLLPQVGEQGQRRLGRAAVLIVGCGALGSHQAEWLARAGVGRLVLVDRDVVELDNLQRQLLFDEAQAQALRPKAEAAAERLAQVNGDCRIEARVLDCRAENVLELVADADLVLDGCDNLETRYLLNDACCRLGKPWVYGGVLGTGGLSLAVLPGQGPCLRCLWPEPPPPGSLPTCETAGVLATAVAAVAGRQVTEAIKILLGAAGLPQLYHLDAWEGEQRRVRVERDARCRCCARGYYDFLAADRDAATTVLCGRNAVQLRLAPADTALDLERLAQRLAGCGTVSANRWLVTLELGGRQLWVFADGRVQVRGTTDATQARNLVAKYLGM